MDCPSRNRDQLTVIDLGIAILAAATAGEVLFLVVILYLFVSLLGRLLLKHPFTDQQCYYDHTKLSQNRDR